MAKVIQISTEVRRWKDSPVMRRLMDLDRKRAVKVYEAWKSTIKKATAGNGR